MNTRKELPKTALPRIYCIDRQIASGAYPNTRELAETYETSEATISRDIEFMRNMLNAPIAYSREHNGYYYAEKTFRLSAGYATAEEMLALGCNALPLEPAELVEDWKIHIEWMQKRFLSDSL
jgi:predicted DNA-binding transcriptional regulator YafY